jgi:membrane protease YdiL (CAAX protease family)
MNRSIRNIMIFGAVTLACGFLGHAINTLYHPSDPMQSVGVLIWLVSPLATNLLLRSIGRDGWKDSGFALHIKSGWPWYLMALIIVPAISFVIIAIGNLIGVSTSNGFSSQGMKTFLSLLVTAFAGSMVKNLFEEFAWRGYLTPRLMSLKANPIISSIVTGFIWACWHIPYYLYFLNPLVLKDQTTLGIPALIILSFVLLPFQAFAYGELRLISKSVWTTWLLHNIANAFSFALITGGFVVLSKNYFSTLFTPDTEGIVYSLLMGAIGLWLYGIRSRKQNQG